MALIAHLQKTATTADGAAHSFAAALARALRQLDGGGRLTLEDARLLRQLIAETPREHRIGVAIEPERHFGPFESLPRRTQGVIVQAILDDDWWRTAGDKLGHRYSAMSLWVQRARAKVEGTAFEHKAGALAQVVQALVQSGPRRGLQEVYRQRLRWQGRFMPRPTLAAVLKLAEVEPWNFAIGYAREIPQLPAFRGFWHDPSRHHTVGVMVGIDLLPDQEGWWCIETNLNSALRLERTAIYDRDPLVANLLEFVKTRGYRHLMVMTGNGMYVDGLMAKQYEEGAAAHKIRLTLLENANLPQKTYRQSYGVPRLDKDGTLVMRIKMYRTSLDFLFQHKRASRQALEMYKHRSADPDLRLVPTGLEPILNNPAADDPLPNLVYKFPERDRGTGLIFLKARSDEHASTLVREAISANSPKSFVGRLKERMPQWMDDQTGIFQPYMRPVMLPGCRLYIVRAHVLLTPIGNHFLSAHRVVCGSSVPDFLPFGLVRDPRPYLVNYSRGARYEVVPAEEEPAVIRAAMAVANGLSWAAAYGFQTTAT
jgi:hypothetical protein